MSTSDCFFISIHAPTRGATYLFCTCSKRLLFQSTLLQEERPEVFLESRGYRVDFNPRSYKRSDLNKCAKGQPCHISIHAPTRGATRYNRPLPKYRNRFQSTLLQEERPLCIAALTSAVPISIHAPTRGATQWQQEQRCWAKFQSTLLQEERHHCHHYTRKTQQFQSTLLQEERRS